MWMVIQVKMTMVRYVEEYIHSDLLNMWLQPLAQSTRLGIEEQYLGEWRTQGFAGGFGTIHTHLFPYCCHVCFSSKQH